MVINKSKLCILSLVYVFSLIPVFSVNAAQEVDPCDSITGKWSGVTNGYKCTWDATAEFRKYKSTIRMDYHLKPRAKCGDELDIIYSGTCKNAYITIETHVVGTIFGDSIFLRDTDGTEVNLHKQ